MQARVVRSFGVVHRANKTMVLVGKVPKEKVLTTNYIAETDEWSKQIQQETAVMVVVVVVVMVMVSAASGVIMAGRAVRVTPSY